MDILATLSTVLPDRQTQRPSEWRQETMQASRFQVTSLEPWGPTEVPVGGTTEGQGFCPTQACFKQTCFIFTVCTLLFMRFIHMNRRFHSENKLKNQTGYWFWTWTSKIFSVLEVTGVGEVVEQKLFLNILQSLIMLLHLLNASQNVKW